MWVVGKIKQFQLEKIKEQFKRKKKKMAAKLMFIFLNLFL